MRPKKFAVNWFLTTKNHCIPLSSASQRLRLPTLFPTSLQPKVSVRLSLTANAQHKKTNSIPDQGIVTVVLHGARVTPLLNAMSQCCLLNQLPKISSK
jgi:hypothetical protein